MQHTSRLSPWLRFMLPLFGIIAVVPACGRKPPGVGAAPTGPETGVDSVTRVDPPPAAGYCAPVPITRASDLAPGLHGWILSAQKGACHLVSRTSAGTIDGFPTKLDTFPAPGTESCDATGCWTDLKAFARAWTHVPRPAPFSPPTELLGEKWAGMVRAARNKTTGEIRATLVAMQYGSSAVRRFERRFDAAAHLLEEQHYFGSSIWFATTNTWEGDRLVASRFVDSINGTKETDYAWSYAGGRLVRATVKHPASGRTAVAEFSYDSEGRLVSVTRTVDGQVWSRQRWSYDRGRLVRSATDFVPGLYQSTAGVRGADSLEPLIVASSQLEWVAARPLPPAGGGCASLPHALSYGYPAADGVYALGWPVGDRPDNIDSDYGFGPAYDIAVDRWFGHDRVEGIAWNVNWKATGLSADIDYDGQGRMTNDKLAASDGSLSSVRARAFDGDRLIKDTRVLSRDGARLTTELAFAYDGAGRLSLRDYTMNGVLVAQHTWSYAAAEITRHTVAHHPVFAPGLDQPGVIPPGLASLPAQLPPPVVHERSFSADGRTISIRRNGVLAETRTRDAEGHILSRIHPPSSVELYAYGPSGDLLSFSSDWNADAVPDMSLSYELAPDGRLLRRHWSYSPDRSDTDHFTYACE